VSTFPNLFRLNYIKLLSLAFSVHFRSDWH